VTAFSHPDFSAERFAHAPDARFVPAPSDGVLPEGFFSTTNLPTYVRVAGRWRMPREPRMDSVLVLEPDGELWVREGRRVRAGDPVAVGFAEDGSDGIFVHAEAFLGDSSGEFKFMTSEVSREKPIDYGLMARILIAERERGGFPVWVAGPALVHSRARADMVWFVEQGFVGALLAAALHAIATGNMLPAFVTEPDGSLRELPTICVDSSEFVVSKLKDRGTHQAFGVVTNAQDFMHILRLYVERELAAAELALAASAPSPTAR